MATVDPNQPVQKDVRANDPWTEEANGTPGSPDTQLVVGHTGQPTNKEAALVDSSYKDGKTTDTEGIYQSPGYSLGTQEDDTTNPHTVVPNSNPGQKVDNFTGTTNGATAAATIVPGDTEFAFGHDTASGNIPYLANQPGAKQPDITSGPDAFFGATQGTPPNSELDTLSFKGGAGVLSPTYGQVSVTSGTSQAQFGQANNQPGDLDTTNTAIPTTTSTPNTGTILATPSGYDLTGGGQSVKDTLYGYPGLTAGVGVTAPGAPTAVTWAFESGSSVVSWTAPASAGGGHIREYVVYGWRVADAAHLPANTAAADAYLTNGIPPTVTGHSRGETRFKADGTTVSLEPAAELRIEHLTPGDFYFFRVAARNEVATGLLSALGAASGTQTSPDYFLDAQKLDGTRVLVPGTADLPEGESLSELTFTGAQGIDETGATLTGEIASELAEAGEEGDDRI